VVTNPSVVRGLKKADLDPVDVKLYQPILNLSVLSNCWNSRAKILDYLTSSNISRRRFSNNWLIFYVHCTVVTLLPLLNLFAAFETVVHMLPIRRLEVPYGVCRGDTVRNWCSYLSGNRLKYVRSGHTRSTPTVMLFGITQHKSQICLICLNKRRHWFVFLFVFWIY